DPDAFGPPAEPVVALFSAVDFATGARRDMLAVTDAVHAAGGLVVWDLSHAAGAIPLDLDGLGADAAVGCTYKYLCGGPGSPAYLYLPHRHQPAIAPAIPGWQGHADPFGLAERYLPADGIERGRIGTPPILSMIAVSRALDVWDGVAMADVRAKSLALTDLVIAYADTHLRPFGVEVVTPRPHDRRGSQVSLRVADAYPVSRALIARGVTGDFRAPDVLRLGMAPLYLSHAEVWDAMGILGDVLATGAHHDPALTRGRQPTT
ncbi:MAG: aminotransferase class V-fold PLP-dependent enzyme, partial [Acidimicrobiales bacterium]